MAGRVADGVFIRVGRHEANIRTAIEAVHRGALEAGRDPDDIRIALILHTILTDDLNRAALISRSMAAGYYEYSPMLFDPPGFVWDGPDIEALKKEVWPDFHHAADLEASDRTVAFLSDEIANAFSLFGTAEMIAEQLHQVLSVGHKIDMLIPHPMPTPSPRSPRPDFIERVPLEVISKLKDLAK
jgi:alkanesulfonate monooxygenase SsuD/methylene tetrahydromethanopterin reductase-like flavin-dependent oxidoreductase (luciferase family)